MNSRNNYSSDKPPCARQRQDSSAFSRQKSSSRVEVPKFIRVLRFQEMQAGRFLVCFPHALV